MRSYQKHRRYLPQLYSVHCALCSMQCALNIIIVGYSVIVGHYGILPCAASLKSLQGLEVRFNFAVF